MNTNMETTKDESLFIEGYIYGLLEVSELGGWLTTKVTHKSGDDYEVVLVKSINYHEDCNVPLKNLLKFNELLMRSNLGYLFETQVYVDFGSLKLTIK